MAEESKKDERSGAREELMRPPINIDVLRAHARHEHVLDPDPRCRACWKFAREALDAAHV